MAAKAARWQVPGRRTGRVISFPLVVADHQGERYLACSPGGRIHIPVDPQAPLEEFEQIAAQYPVFRITPDRSASPPGSGR
ncbi:hypothetical protein [Streptosporangium sp. NPDC087985]|uniref:hypothetical protein n=1 Tax=Streptosporangium sp. NPDC087985 TaxID=3366196 RepID=UPI003823931A